MELASYSDHGEDCSIPDVVGGTIRPELSL